MSGRAECTDPALEVLVGPYELGLLTEDERGQFERHLENCGACRAELFEMSAHSAALQADPGRALERLAPSRAWIAQVRRMSWRIVVPSLAAAAAILIISNFRSRDDWAHLARIEAVPYVQMETRATQLNASDRLIQEGMARYVAEDYPRAAPLLAEAARLMGAEAPGGRQVSFYAGLSFLLAAEPDSAMRYLATAKRASMPVIADRAAWALAQAHLLRGEPDEASILLEPLAHGSPGYRDQAAEQLAKIRAAQRR